MKIYNALFERYYKNVDSYSYVYSFKERNAAVNCLENAIEDEIRDKEYSDDDLKNQLVRKKDDFFCFYEDDRSSDWKFRCQIFETDLI